MSLLTAVSKKITKAKGPSILSADIVRELTNKCPGINFDQGGRLNLWHPKQDKFQGVFYYHKHIGPMDRGICPMYAVYNSRPQLAKVDVMEALRQDIPLLSLDKFGNESVEGAEYGYALKHRIQDVDKVGWTQTFYRLLQANLPGVTKEWLATTFRVPMGWYADMKRAPLQTDEVNELADQGLVEEVQA